MARRTVGQVKRLFHEIGMGEMIGPVNEKKGEEWTYTILWFQRGFAKYNLRRDGKMTNKTYAALKWSAENGGRTSPNFRFIEFKSKGNGHICIHRRLVRSVEALRREINRPIGVLSGFRDTYHNDVRIKGATKSQHKYGKAFDPVQNDIPFSVALKLKRFTGLGYVTRNGKKYFRHGDVRGGATNFTGGTLNNPTIWSYDGS